VCVFVCVCVSVGVWGGNRCRSLLSKTRATTATTQKAHSITIKHKEGGALCMDEHQLQVRLRPRSSASMRAIHTEAVSAMGMTPADGNGASTCGRQGALREARAHFKRCGR
jgi:hypothetical protein